MEIQNEFDKKHGWSNSEAKTIAKKIDQLKDDIVGFTGEMGEFSNIVKKISREPSDEMDIFFENNIENMNEEIVDVFIYLLRIMITLDIDLEKEYLKKLEFNERRFKKFE
ncbi:hypothetical protein IGJ12_001349 [Enterococcus sp. DIV0802b]